MTALLEMLFALATGVPCSGKRKTLKPIHIVAGIFWVLFVVWVSLDLS